MPGLETEARMTTESAEQNFRERENLVPRKQRAEVLEAGLQLEQQQTRDRKRGRDPEQPPLGQHADEVDHQRRDLGRDPSAHAGSLGQRELSLQRDREQNC